MSYYLLLSHFLVGIVNITFARASYTMHTVDPHLICHTIPLFVFMRSKSSVYLYYYYHIGVVPFETLPPEPTCSTGVYSYSPLLLGCSLLDQKR
jgi:hypothetical protein